MEPFYLHRGYSLIELMVVLAIIGVLTVIALTSQSTFNKTFVLANAAYDVSLAIRSAEGFGVGSRATGGVHNAAYGIHFEKGTPGQFILFADTYDSIFPPCNLNSTPDCKPSKDHIYTAGRDTVVQTYELGNGITLDNFCALTQNSDNCSNNGAADSLLTAMDITFDRPYINTNITGSIGSGYVKACLTLKAPSGDVRYVAVSASSLISPGGIRCP